MRVKCEYCGSYILDTDETCPSCGAPNEHMARSASGIPKTIGELRAFAEKHNLPLEKMRFFIGEDYRGAKAFGIYEKPGGIFVVYKNKADGSRAVRYEGTDEAYAVNELYLKMKQEVDKRIPYMRAGTRPPGSSGGRREGFVSNLEAARNGERLENSYEYRERRPDYTGGSSKPPNRKNRGPVRGCLTAFLVVLAIFIVFGIIGTVINRTRPVTGYYSYNGRQYYYDSDDWYIYSGTDDWIPAVVDEELRRNYDDYYDSAYYRDDYGASDFYDSDYYTPGTYEYHDTGNGYDYNDSGYDYDYDNDTWDDDWDDDDWDWDNDWDWDTGDTDWDDDW
ncbi:MAG: hypothetical protein IKG08_01380 [Eubacterium sp.]|nr:hypothetical protein [Eubacterium sp.]